MATATATQRLAEVLLGESLERFVRSRRAEGKPWRIVARDLWHATNGEVDVTYETLRTWFPDEKPRGRDVVPPFLRDQILDPLAGQARSAP